jgi:two-component system, cell cycle sensor histidine kinase and response regulator CckA
VEPKRVGPTWEQLDAVPAAIAFLEGPATVLWGNAEFWRATGGGQERSRDLVELLSPSGLASVPIRRALSSVFSERVIVELDAVEVSTVSPGRGRFLRLQLRPISTSDSHPPQAALLVRDVTDQIQEQEEAILFHQSFLSSSNAIEVTDHRGILVDVNPAFERIYGYTRAECIGRRPSLVRGRTTPPELYDRMWRDLLDPQRGYWSGELRNRERMGRERPVFLTITAIRNSSGETTHYLGVAIDLAEQKAWERAAEHADKLSSLGQLAAGVAHEINTPLANVMLIAESIRRKSTDPWVQARTETIAAQVDIAGQIVRGLLDFAHRSEPQVGKLDLVEVTRSALIFLKGKQSENVEFQEQYPDGPLPLWGDRNQLIQVFTNLLNNACEAMEGRGLVVVAVRARGEEAEVEIRDNGPGIPPEVLSHIFEPFYTTKPEGKGTGLGLAICHGILQAHHGSIAVRSTPGEGASFLVTLPLSAA